MLSKSPKSKLMLCCFFAVLSSLLIVEAHHRRSMPLDCNRENEIYMCGSACQTECRTLGQQCPIVNIRCNDSCYCIDGYARDSSGKCIPISECPK